MNNNCGKSGTCVANRVRVVTRFRLWLVFTAIAACALAPAGWAKIIQFDLRGTAGVGLLPGNETPAVSGGAGGEIGAGISYNDVTRVLTLNVGWGSSQGFVNLSGTATASHIHGPTAANLGNDGSGIFRQTAAVLFNLSRSSDAVTGGTFTTTNLTLTAAQETNLLNGQYYINLHTTSVPGGELRGFLVPAPTILWTAAPVTGPADVSTAGTLVGALNVGGSGIAQTVNGVNFAGDGAGSAAIALGTATVQFNFDNSVNADFWATAAPGGNVAYGTALDSGRWVDTWTNGMVALNGLVVGRRYQVQLWITDTRVCCSNRLRSVDGVATVSNGSNVLRGVFTADAASKLITIDGAGFGPQLNLMQLRDLGQPLVTPAIPINGGITSILLYVDDQFVSSAYQRALDHAGLTYTLFTSEAAFNAAVTASTPPTTLAIVDSIDSFHALTPLPEFIARSGRALMYYWDLDGAPALAAAFNATAVQDIFAPVSVNDWGGSFFFNQVTNPLALFERGYNDDGDKLQPTLGGVAVAGHTAAAANGQAAVVIGNSGRTIVNSMALQDATNAPAQAAQFALNEIFYLLAPVHSGGRVAVLAAEGSASWKEDVRQKLLATAAFEAVDVIGADTGTPTLAQLQPYSAVLVFSDGTFANSTGLGNVLADYADAGGGVVISTFALYTSGTGYGLDGRLLTGGYLPFVAGSTFSGTEITLVPDQAGHPILAGVGSLSGGTSSYHNAVTVASNAALVAHWSNGRPLVVTKVTGQARVVGLNFFPPSESVRNDLWRTNSDGGLLMANALRWAGLPDCTLQTNYVAGMNFMGGLLEDGPMGMAFDGTNFWSVDGGGTVGNRLSRYTAGGVFLAAYAPGIDFRSIFTDAAGRIYARGFNSANILRQTTPGTFVTNVTLVGGSLDSQASVVLNGNGSEYVAVNSGTVQRWSTNGSFIGTVALAGYGTLAGDSGFPQSRRLAAVGNHWLTYNGNRVLSIWNQSGVRIATTVLQGASTDSDGSYSFSYCAGRVFVEDSAGAPWRGYDICTSPERPMLSQPVNLGGGQFQFNLHAPAARSYVLQRSANMVSWTPFLTNTPLAPNTTITDTGATGTNLFYRAHRP